MAIIGVQQSEHTKWHGNHFNIKVNMATFMCILTKTNLIYTGSCGTCLSIQQGRQKDYKFKASLGNSVRFLFQNVLKNL